MKLQLHLLLSVLAFHLAGPVTSHATVLLQPGFTANSLAANDDGSTGLVPIGFDLNFYGSNFSSLFVNNNGNVTFTSAYDVFTPLGISGVPQPIIAPFFADVDTRGAGSNLVTYGTDTVGGRPAFGVNWLGVGYFSSADDKLNDIQLVLIDRSDVGAGDFDMQFNYGTIQWEAGNASGGVGGLGGTAAAAGWSNGAGQYQELPGSLTPGAFLASGANDLNGKSFTFSVRNGTVSGVPEPETALPLLAMFAIPAVAGRKRIKLRN